MHRGRRHGLLLSLTRRREAQPQADAELGRAVAAAARRKRHPTYPELGRARGCRLIVVGIEVGGRCGTEAAQLLQQRLLGRRHGLGCARNRCVGDSRRRGKSCANVGKRRGQLCQFGVRQHRVPNIERIISWHSYNEEELGLSTACMIRSTTWASKLMSCIQDPTMHFAISFQLWGSWLRNTATARDLQHRYADGPCHSGTFQTRSSSCHTCPERTFRRGSGQPIISSFK